MEVTKKRKVAREGREGEIMRIDASLKTEKKETKKYYDNKDERNKKVKQR